jgi:anti-sigma regulatory factor (Ser/Thr protein kinase)
MAVEPQPRASRGWRFTVAATAPYWARTNTRWFLEHSQGASRDLIDTALLVVSEIVTNAYAAASRLPDETLIDFSLRLFDDRLLIEVIDSSPEVPALESTETSAEDGRGLELVDFLSFEWGYFWHQGRKVVYSILALAPEIACQPAFISEIASDKEI